MLLLSGVIRRAWPDNVKPTRRNTSSLLPLLLLRLRLESDDFDYYYDVSPPPLSSSLLAIVSAVFPCCR